MGNRPPSLARRPIRWSALDSARTSAGEHSMGGGSGVPLRERPCKRYVVFLRWWPNEIPLTSPPWLHTRNAPGRGSCRHVRLHP